MNENADGRRVITGMRHGGHAIVDKAPGADRAVEHGSVRLSEITQDAEIAKTDGIAGALALAGVSDFDYLFPALANDPAKLLPAETPQIAETTVAALNALGTAMIVIISVEFLRAKQGVGFITFYYWEVLNPEKMYAGLLVVMMLGVGLTYGLQWLQRRMMPWQR